MVVRMLTERRPLRSLSILVLLTLLCGCFTPVPVKSSAFVPRPQAPSQAGGPMGEEHGLRVFGGISFAEIAETVPAEISLSVLSASNSEELLDNLTSDTRLGRAGLLIPTLHVGGGVYGAPSAFFEVGAQLHATHLDWTKPNLDGVLPFPDEEADQWLLLGGPGIRINLPIEDTSFVPAILAEFNLTSIPQAVYECVSNCVTTVNPSVIEMNELNDVTLAPRYRFVRLDRERFLLPNLHLHLSYDAHEWVDVVGFLGGQRNVKNIGFDPDRENLDDDTFETYWFSTAGAGIDIRYSGLSLTALVFFSFLEPEEVPSTLSGSLQVGFLL